MKMVHKMAVVNQLSCKLYLHSCQGSMYRYVDYFLRRNVEFSKRLSSFQNNRYAYSKGYSSSPGPVRKVEKINRQSLNVLHRYCIIVGSPDAAHASMTF